MGNKPLEEIRFGHLYRILLSLLDYEKQGYQPSLAELIEKAGISESAFYTRVNDRLIRAGLVKEEILTFRIKTLKLTDKGRKLAECLLPCRDLILDG